MHLPSWDIFLTVFFIIGVAYGFLLQRDKIMVSLVATYIAIVIANSFGSLLQQFFVGDKVLFGQVWIRANASLLTIKLVLFAATILAISARNVFVHSTRARSSHLPPIEILAYSVLNTLLIISSVISFLPDQAKQNLITASKFASRINSLQLWWIALPVALLIFTGFSRGERSSSSED